jgi:hypothetical protein
LGATNITNAENAAVAALGGPGMIDAVASR